MAQIHRLDEGRVDVPRSRRYFRCEFHKVFKAGHRVQSPVGGCRRQGERQAVQFRRDRADPLPGLLQGAYPPPGVLLVLVESLGQFDLSRDPAYLGIQQRLGARNARAPLGDVPRLDFGLDIYRWRLVTHNPPIRQGVCIACGV